MRSKFSIEAGLSGLFSVFECVRFLAMIRGTHCGDFYVSYPYQCHYLVVSLRNFSFQNTIDCTRRTYGISGQLSLAIPCG